LAAVLTLQKFESLLPAGLPVVCLDRDWDAIATESSENPISQATAENLAYVIYTSGSTGLPKGVLIEHRGAVNTILDINQRFGVTAGDRVLAVCSLNFDLSVYDVFGLLGVGGTLILPQPAVAPDLNEWSALMHQHQVTVWNSAPPVMQMFAGHLVDRAAQLPTSLKLVMLSGDWIPVTLPNLIRQLKADNSSTQVISLGGATEASIWSNFYAIDHVDPSWKSIPYGKPLGNQKFHILDERQNPVAIGEVGELYIGGAGVARGYHNRPELNASKFIADPFADPVADPLSDQPTKLYRTGDLGRYLPDGNMEFLGRIDHQVKIRGFRVEMGEIEVALSQHPAVRESAVLAQADPSDTKRLVAYLVCDQVSGQDTSMIESIRNLLKAKLPAYMVPSAFLLLEHLPLTPNGKLDRKALPLADLSATLPNSKTQVAPRNQTECQLVEIWQEFLNVQSIGITDNFFELGGHSLIAVRLWSKVEQVFGQSLPLSMLFQAPTIEQLAAKLQPEAETSPVTCPSLVIIQQGQPESKPPLFCIHVLGRGLKFYRPMVNYFDSDQPVYGLSTQIAGEDFPSNWVEDLAPHYVQQIRQIQPQGPYLLAGVSFGGLITVEIARLLQASGQSVSLLALMDTRLPGVVKCLNPNEQAATHWRQFAEKGPSYLATKLQRRLAGQFTDFSWSLRDVYFRWCIQLCTHTGQPLREAWQDFCYEEQNSEAISRYRPQPYAGHVTLFRATDQALSRNKVIDPTLGWREMVTGELEIYQVSGTHLGMLSDPNAETIGMTLRDCIRRALG
jgi:aspartate racemase